MAHHYSNSLYDRLADRLNQFPQGAPLSDSLFAILKILFSEKEAGLVAQLPIKPFTVDRAAAIWKLDKATAQNMLEDLAGRAMLLDMEQNGQQMFCLPPPMAGFFEFSMMRVRGDVNQKALAELYYQYLNVEEDFVKALFVENGTPLGRIFVQEAALPQDGKLEVLDYERASHIIKTASHIGVSMCYCRHKMQHLGRACDAPMDICMTFNTSARSLIKYGHARQVDAAECLDLLAVAQGHNLVQFGENAREGVNFICNCCWRFTHHQDGPGVSMCYRWRSMDICMTFNTACDWTPPSAFDLRVLLRNARRHCWRSSGSPSPGPSIPTSSPAPGTIAGGAASVKRSVRSMRSTWKTVRPASASLSSIPSAASGAACACVPVPSASLRSKPGPNAPSPPSIP